MASHGGSVTPDTFYCGMNTRIITRFIKLRYVDMRETIQNYFEKTKQYPNYYSNEDFSNICDDIKKEIDKGVFLVKRKDETDLSVFEEKYGYRWRSGR